MVEVDKENFDETVMQNEKPVLVDFWGPGCGRCIQMMPQVEALEERYGSSIVFTKLNIQGNRRLAIREQVASLPTILLYNKGEKVETFDGNFSVDDVEAKVKELAGE